MSIYVVLRALSKNFFQIREITVFLYEILGLGVLKPIGEALTYHTVEEESNRDAVSLLKGWRELQRQYTKQWLQ